jgi:pseudaminic acid biosynthesis-associated methylase
VTTSTGSGDPLEHWSGAFGELYMQRNQPTPTATADAARAFGRILSDPTVRSEIGSVLEVGANVGINLIGLRRVLDPRVELSALEPNPDACAQLRANQELRLSDVHHADAYRIPLPDDAVDLVFTNGVLIHVPPDKLPAAMQEITRVARRFVLCSEYFSHEPTEAPYRGRTGLLWKRDFGRAYLESCPRLQVQGYGFLWMQEFPHFDNLNWWLFRKGR